MLLSSQYESPGSHAHDHNISWRSPSSAEWALSVVFGRGGRRSQLECVCVNVLASYQPNTAIISQKMVNGAWHVVSRVLRQTGEGYNSSRVMQASANHSHCKQADPKQKILQRDQTEPPVVYSAVYSWLLLNRYCIFSYFCHFWQYCLIQFQSFECFFLWMQ